MFTSTRVPLDNTAVTASLKAALTISRRPSPTANEMFESGVCISVIIVYAFCSFAVHVDEPVGTLPKVEGLQAEEVTRVSHFRTLTWRAWRLRTPPRRKRLVTNDECWQCTREWHRELTIMNVFAFVVLQIRGTLFGRPREKPKYCNADPTFGKRVTLSSGSSDSRENWSLHIFFDRYIRR